MKLIQLSLFFIIFSNCTSLRTSDTKRAENIDPKDIMLFETAFKDLGDGHYARVIPILKDLIKKYPGYDLEWLALYNLASAYKELNQCEEAKDIYRSLPDKTKAAPQLLPRIFLNLAYTYECLGKPEQTLITLKTGMKYAHYLPDESRLMEYPARLSLAYFRMNEQKTGEQLQQQTYKNLEILKKSFRITEATDNNFSRYFYIMGRSHILSDTIELTSFLKMMPYYQVYLSQSMLLSAGEWSVKAERELGNLYRKMWFQLKKQKNTFNYSQAVRKVLNGLRSIARNGKNKKILTIYTTLRKKTMDIMAKKSAKK